MYILKYLIFCTNIFAVCFNFNQQKYNLNTYNIKDNLEKLSLLSKIIYQYDFINDKNIKKNFSIDTNLSNNFTVDFIKNNNIYFGLVQFVTFLNNKNFIKNSKKYFDILNKRFPDVEIYGYFFDKKRLHSLILLDHINEEIIIVFRGSQYIDEWIENIKLYEKNILFCNKKYKIHSGLYNMFSVDNIDNNIVYILKNLFDHFPKYKKIITGHSKGSTNSILLSFELLTKLEIKYNYEIYIFGNPAIFNYDLALYLHTNPNLKIYNVINNFDIITSLPYKYQIGKELLLINDNLIIKEHEKPYNIKYKINIKNIFMSIINHDLNIYIRNIFNLKNIL
jgi:hypothetical protein